jgi:lysozyme family protein
VANYKLVIPHVKRNEGGLADTLKDTNPAKNPSPIKNPKTGLFYHTNKGIIWGTWVAWSKKKGIAVDSQRWYKMSDADWEDVMKTLYWDSVQGDKINSQAIAEILFEAVWGGSAKSLIVYLQTYLRQKGFTNDKGEEIGVDGAMGQNTYQALNKLTKDPKKHAQLIKDLTAKRLATLKTLGSWSWAGKAWTRRLEEIQETGLKYITENPIKTGGGILGILLLGVGAYYLSKGGLPKI